MKAYSSRTNVALSATGEHLRRRGFCCYGQVEDAGRCQLRCVNRAGFDGDHCGARSALDPEIVSGRSRTATSRRRESDRARITESSADTLDAQLGRKFGRKRTLFRGTRMQRRRSALVAQGIEHRFPKPCVACSNHAEGALQTTSFGLDELQRPRERRIALHNHTTAPTRRRTNDLIVCPMQPSARASPMRTRCSADRYPDATVIPARRGRPRVRARLPVEHFGLAVSHQSSTTRCEHWSPASGADRVTIFVAGPDEGHAGGVTAGASPRRSIKLTVGVGACDATTCCASAPPPADTISANAVQASRIRRLRVRSMWAPSLGPGWAGHLPIIRPSRRHVQQTDAHPR